MTTPQLSSAAITANPIDGTFPIAGQDNNSLGFRNNFTNTDTLFDFAANDIQGLWANVDSLNSSQLFSQSFSNIGLVSGNITVSYLTAEFQHLILTANTTITAINNWPVAGVYAKLNLLFDIATSDAITFPVSVLASGSMTGVANITSVQEVISETVQSHASITSPFLFELSTFDSGATVYIQEKIHP